MGLGPWYAFHDKMHVVDLRLVPMMIGGVLWHLCYTDIMSGSPQQRLHEIWGEIEAEYKARNTSCQFSNLLLGMFTNPKSPGSDFPEISGKAAKNQHLLPILRDIWRKRMREIPYEQHIFACLDALCNFQEILDIRGPLGKEHVYLPPELVIALRVSIHKFHTHYNKIRHIAQDENQKLLWNVVPKTHKLWHIGFESQFMNPDLAKCYGNEDFMQIMKIITNSTRHGLQMAFRSKNIVHNYLLGRCLMLFNA